MSESSEDILTDRVGTERVRILDDCFRMKLLIIRDESTDSETAGIPHFRRRLETDPPGFDARDDSIVYSPDTDHITVGIIELSICFITDVSHIMCDTETSEIDHHITREELSCRIVIGDDDDGGGIMRFDNMLYLADGR